MGHTTRRETESYATTTALGSENTGVTEVYESILTRFRKKDITFTIILQHRILQGTQYQFKLVFLVGISLTITSPWVKNWGLQRYANLIPTYSKCGYLFDHHFEV